MYKSKAQSTALHFYTLSQFICIVFISGKRFLKNEAIIIRYGIYCRSLYASFLKNEAIRCGIIDLLSHIIRHFQFNSLRSHVSAYPINTTSILSLRHFQFNSLRSHVSNQYYIYLIITSSLIQLTAQPRIRVSNKYYIYLIITSFLIELTAQPRIHQNNKLHVMRI